MFANVPVNILMLPAFAICVMVIIWFGNRKSPRENNNYFNTRIRNRNNLRSESKSLEKRTLKKAA